MEVGKFHTMVTNMKLVRDLKVVTAVKKSLVL